MGLHTERLCDVPGCGKPGEAVVLWREGEPVAHAVDLCPAHAAPFDDAMRAGKAVELPTKPRQKMELTALKTTERTAAFKRVPKKKGARGRPA